SCRAGEHFRGGQKEGTSSLNRAWLERFYAECGREITLSYTVLNQANTWTTTLFAALVAAIAINGADYNSNPPTLYYPNLILWFYAVLSWVVMLRFFVRASLPLAYLYKWNSLQAAAGKVLS